MEWSWPEGTDARRAAARIYVRETLRPLEPELPAAEGDLPPTVARRCLEARRAAGLQGISVPADRGGPGLPWVVQAAVAEELGGSLLGIDAHGLHAVGEVPFPLLEAAGSPCEPLMRACLRGERQAWQLQAAGLALELGAQGPRLVGRLAAVPEYMSRDVLVAVLSGGRAAVLEPGLPGLRRSAPRPTMGSALLVDLEFDLEVPPGHLLPAAGAGRWTALRRIGLAAFALGAGGRCLEAALEHVRRRQTFGRPLADRQAIQWMLADAARELQVARMLVYRAASDADRGAEPEPAAAAARVLAVEAACRTADRVLQMHGAYGYSRDLPYERYWRDLRYYRLLEGSGPALAAAGAGALLAELDS